ncbi:hypothetical protein MSAN_01969200 [Mycena sanguinolenta]|uniref:SAM domain-containing protein n=1 Tax=Mycena sanguinolenta TaxID=230812 RepID=A0A8H6XP22_9AGAR|nr:hypothetical protein MSAN_01969200 [Mycena sanguinolenta]
MTEQPLQPSSARNLRVHRGPIITGGVGGDGGFGARHGGHGGVGRGSRMDLNDALRLGAEIEGGGGKGGMGGTGNGGNGGDGEDTEFTGGKCMREELEFIDIDPEVQLVQLGLSTNSYVLLTSAGYENVGGLLEATKGDLQSAGLQSGEINQLKYNLKKYALAHPFKT